MYAAYIVYNNEATIRESLESILPYVEKVIAVDGAYARYPHKKPQSTDGTREIFHELCGDKLIWVDCGGKPCPTQIGKRNEYVKRVPEGKWFLVIDGDAVIKGRIKEGFRFAESSKYICIGVKSLNYEPAGDVSYADSGRHTYAIMLKDVWNKLEWKEVHGVGTWLYRKTKDMMYKKHHSTIYIGNKMISKAQTVLKDIVVENMNYKMGWERWCANIQYKTSVKTH